MSSNLGNDYGFPRTNIAPGVYPQRVITSAPPSVNESFADLFVAAQQAQDPENAIPTSEECAGVYVLRMRFVATDKESADTIRSLCTGLFTGDTPVGMLLGWDVKEQAP